MLSLLRSRIPLGLGIVALACAIIPGVASASTTVGATGSSGALCPTDVTELQTQVGPGVPSYTVQPPGGVVTSWSYLGGSTSDRVRLALFEPAGFMNGYVITAESSAMTAPAGVLSTFPTRLRTQSGDMLGIVDLGAGSSCDLSTGAAGDVVARCTSCDVSAFPGTVTASSITGRRVNVSAVVEPDADGDGYGDETQDQCLNDPYTALQPCSADLSVTLVAPASVAQGSEIDYQVIITNNGPSIATGISISAALPSGATFIPQHSTSTCGGTTTIVCTVAPMTPNTSMVGSVIAASADQIGTLTATATLGHAITPDPNSANDSASATTGVTPVLLTPEQLAALFAGVGVSNQTLVPSGNRLVKVKASCPPPASVRCRGTLTLTTSGKVTLPRTKSQTKRHRKPSRKVLTLGRAAFSIPLNKSASISVRLSKTAMSVLARSLSLDVVATAAASDAAAHTKTTTADVLLAAPDPPMKRHKTRAKR